MMVVAATVLCSVSVAGFCFNIPILGALGLAFFVGSLVLQPALTMHVFGGREYQAANRFWQIIVHIITACGIPFMTDFMDLTGSYKMAYYVLLVMNIAVLCLMLLCRNTYAED